MSRTLSTARRIGVAASLVALAGGAHAGGLVEIEFDLANFNAPLVIDNPYLPLVPGRHIVYWEIEDDECKVNDFIVTNQVKDDFGGAYAGLEARVVHDQEWLDEDCDLDRDVLLEDTYDWHGQDDAGNAWYFGEDTTEYLFDDDGNPAGSSTEGSWEAGVDGAIAGLVMLAQPQKGLFYRQEFYEDVAEDAAKVLRTDTEVSIGIGDFDHCIAIKEWTPLEPGALEHKHYCPGIGLVQVDHVSGGKTLVIEAVDLGL